LRRADRGQGGEAADEVRDPYESDLDDQVRAVLPNASTIHVKLTSDTR